MNKLVIVIMGPGKQHFLDMCFDSVKDADKILYFTSDYSFSISPCLKHLPDNQEVHYNGWDDNDMATNGKCRQKYLDYLKQAYPNDWCLVLDEDEILEEEGIEKIKKFISEREPGIYNVKMRHFIGDLGHEDNTRPVHVVPGRLFKISEAKGYPLHSHPVLEGELKGACLDTTIWHLGHLPVEYMDYILKRYKQHASDSIIHNQDFLKQWKMAHLLGLYPTKQINPVELPKQICDRYEINKDEFYFANRGLEVKHFLMAKQWINYFDNNDRECNFVEFGCGRAPFGFAIASYDYDYLGFDISKFAVDNAFRTNSGVMDVCEGDITKIKNKNKWKYKVCLCIDILEHLTDEQLDKALKNILSYSDNFLFSIPFEGDPNLEADSTHKQFHDKQWWIDKISSYGILVKDVPQDWLFSNQLLIGEKK